MNTLLTEAPASQISLDSLLEEAVATDVSDIHLVPGNAPAMRRHGVLQSVPGAVLSADDVEAMITLICPADRRAELDGARNMDFALRRDVGGSPRRFRVNAFYAGGLPACCLRLILERVPDALWTGFPTYVLERITQYRNGLVLFTGITGSGKSTSLAMLIERINNLGGRRIITLEDPVEYVFDAKPNTVITQREVGVDVRSFAEGLKYGLRQDPDVVLVGEIRDRETAQLAVTAAETGHLVFATLHTADAKGAITRLTDMSSPEMQNELRTQLALSLRAIVSQHLLPPADDDRRVLAMEVMFNSLAIRSAIRSGKVESIDDAILAGKADGMLSLDQCLRTLVDSQRITLDTALRYANNPQRFGGK